MGTLRIEQYGGPAREFQDSQQGSQTMPMPVLPLLAAAETLTTSGVTAASATLNDATRAIFVRSTGGTNVAVRIGTNTPTALITDASVVDGEGRWFGISNALFGQALKLAAIDY